MRHSSPRRSNTSHGHGQNSPPTTKPAASSRRWLSNRPRARRARPARVAVGNGCSTLPADWASMPSTSRNASAKSSPSNGMRRWRPSPERISGGWAQRTYGLSTPPPRRSSPRPGTTSTGSTPTPTDAAPKGASWCGWRIVLPTYRSCCRNSVASPRTSASRTPRCSTSVKPSGSSVPAARRWCRCTTNARKSSSMPTARVPC